MKLLNLLNIIPFIYAKTIIIGDSILHHQTIQNDLENFANITIQNFAKDGASFQQGWVQSIPDEYKNNNVSNTSTVIMNGGGNDIFSNFNDCVYNNCPKVIDNIITKIKKLFGLMIYNNVKHIIFVGPYYVSILKNTINNGVKKFMIECNKLKQCHFIDLRNISIPLSLDGRHPTEEGYHMISKQIINTLTKYNITLD
jgi:lysophospholipase L1-like esterase